MIVSEILKMNKSPLFFTLTLLLSFSLFANNIAKDLTIEQSQEKNNSESALNQDTKQSIDSLSFVEQKDISQNNDTLFYTETIEALQNDQKIEKQKTYNLPLLSDVDSNVEQRRFTKKFKDKYKKDPNFRYTEQRVSAWTKLKQDINRFLIDFFDFFNVDVDPRATSNLWLFTRIFGAVVLLLIIYYLIKAYLAKDMYWMFKKSAKNFQVDYQQVEQNLQNTDFKTLIKKAQEAKNYSAAIRLYYLWVLKDLDQREIICFDSQKTNASYLLQIKDQKLNQEFKQVCYLYNHIWYGQRDISQQEFFLAEQSFIKILNKQ